MLVCYLVALRFLNCLIYVTKCTGNYFFLADDPFFYSKKSTSVSVTSSFVNKSGELMFQINLTVNKANRYKIAFY